MLKIGISGNRGSFSEEAGEYYTQKNKIKDFEFAYLVSVENVLSSLDRGEVDLGIFPIENSNGGIVYEAVYAMARHLFKIKKIFEIDIKHCLLALPSAEIKDIKKIASHDQALKQCKMYLKRKWPNAELIEWEDTAQSAKDLSSGKLTPNTAVIAPAQCAKLYGLKILEEKIQDLKFNFTSFIVAER